MNQFLEFLIEDNKVKNHWKLFIQILIFVSAKFIHSNIISLLMSYFPKFEDFRNNKTESRWIMFWNFLIDCLLTFPMIFLAFTFYKYGNYILLPIVLCLMFLLPLLNKTQNITKFGSNPRRGVIIVEPMKFKFTFLDSQISIIYLIVSFAILFCDTTMFDNVLSKTTKGGIGTMDLGAGFILFTSGTTSRQTRGTLII